MLLDAPLVSVSARKKVPTTSTNIAFECSVVSCVVTDVNGADSHSTLAGDLYLSEHSFDYHILSIHPLGPYGENLNPAAIRDKSVSRVDGCHPA